MEKKLQSSVGCPAVLWRGARDGRDGQTAGGAEVTALGLIMRCGEWILGSGSRDSRWCQCAPPPRSPGRFLAPSGTGLVTLSNRTDSATVDRSTPAPIPPHHHISMEAKLFSDRESGGELAGSCIPGRTPFPTLCLHACHLSALSTPPQAAQCRVGHCLAGDVLARIKEAGRCGWKRVWWKPSLRSLGKRKTSGSEKSGISESLAFMFLLIWVTRRRGDHQAPVRRPLPLDHTRLEIPS